MPITERGGLIIGVGAGFLGANVFLIGMRLYVRARVSKNLNYNDGFIVTALLANASLTALVILAAQNGIGGHTINASLPEIGNALKYIFFLELIYVILTSFMKVSIAITLRQWARQNIMIWLLRLSIVVDFLISAAFVIFLLVQCQPISHAWRLTDPTAKGKCLPFVVQLYMGYALSITTISLDMLFLFGPFFMLKGRRVNSHLKGYIYAIIGLGILASIANFIRLGALVKLKASADPLFDAAPVFLWSAVEVSIGICVAGILEMGPLMRKWNVKGFEDYSVFASLGDDDTKPMNLQDIDFKRPVLVHTSSIRRPTNDLWQI